MTGSPSVLARSLLLVSATLAAPPALAQDGIEILISHTGRLAPDGSLPIDIRLLNPGDTAQVVPLSDHMEARLDQGDQQRTVWLKRTAPVSATITVAPHGFAVAQYRLTADLTIEGSLLTVPGWSEQQVALRPAPAGPAIAHSPTLGVTGAEMNALPTPPAADRSVGNAFIENLSAYEPIYAVYGPGTNTEGRIQFSFKYQLFGSRAREERDRSLIDGLYFAYTQRMFWDLGAQSSPFRNVDYQPELFYLSPPVPVGGKATVSGQLGLRHESNGRDGIASRSLNTLYVAPMAAVPLGSDWRLTVAPRLWFFVGGRTDNPDIDRYRGHTGLFLEVGEVNGLRLSTSTRFNFSSGKGAVAADLSYPLRRILGGGPDFYIFGQSFLGYGENLLDYDKRSTRLRIGIALIR